jgi:valyl-tRNA synthetase
LRDVTWNELADWYLEGAKIEGGKGVLLQYILQNVITLWHPYMPFVTEAIWQEAYAVGSQDFLMTRAWPNYIEMPIHPEAEKNFERAQRVIIAVRALRAEYKIEPKLVVPVTVITKYKNVLAPQQMLIERLARCELLFADAAPEGQLATVIEEGTITIPKPEATGSPDERGKLEAERASVAQYIEALNAKLANQDFVARAPQAVVQKEQEKLKEAKEKLAALHTRLGD